MSCSRSFLLMPLVLAWLAGCGASPPPAAHVPTTGAVQWVVSTPGGAPDMLSRVTLTDGASRATPLVPVKGTWVGVLEGLAAGAHHTFRVQAFDATGALRHEERVEDVPVTAGATGRVQLYLREQPRPLPDFNTPPFIDSLVASHTTVDPGGVVALSALAHDPDPGDSLSYTWEAASGHFSAPDQASTTWTAPTASPGPVSLWLTVSDSRGAAFTVELALEVSAGHGGARVEVDFNALPRVLALTSSRGQLDVGQTTALSLTASDADGDPLGYQWSATCAGTFTGAASASATFTPSALPGGTCDNCQLTVTVTDGRGGQNTGRLAVCVARSTPSSAPPVLTRSFQSSLVARAGQTLSFEVEARDPADLALTFAWTASKGVIGTPTSDASSSRATWTAPACASTPPSLTATVTNALGRSTLKRFTVTGPPACPPASWSSTGALRAARNGHTATLLPNGKVLVTGGYNGDVALGSAELYDPATGTWSATGALSISREGHRATLLANGRVLVSGGYTLDGGGRYLATAELYDPATGTWSTTGTMLQPRYHFTATRLSDGRVLATGGYNVSTGYHDKAELYDPATGSWSAVGSMTAARGYHTATLLPSGKVLSVGGLVSGRTAEVYDPATGTWSATGALLSWHSNHTATLLPSGQVLVTAGGGSGGIQAAAELYDPATNRWSATGALTAARELHTAVLLPSGQVLVAGGRDNVFLASAEVYDPATGTWSATAAMATARDWHQATLLPSGQVLVSGGYNPSYLRAAELYDPGG